MFRVAVVVNENEVAHSSFANTVAVLKRPVSLGDQKLQSYKFTEFDKFSVPRLFQQGHQDHLFEFDSLIISTNATNNAEVLGALRGGQKTIEEFIEIGKGVLILSQKKLSKQIDEAGQKTGFLPERYDYSIHDRPEPSSAAGLISVVDDADRILSYPNHIDTELIEYRCKYNSFMEHRYRSIVAPTTISQFIAVLIDRSLVNVPRLQMGFPPGRPVMVRTANSFERIVATTMALDWGAHEELLENILIYITEGSDQIAVLRRKGAALDSPIDVYTTRARAAKFAIREYFDFQIDQIALLNHRTIIVSPAYSIGDVEEIWRALSQRLNVDIDLYHMLQNTGESGFQLVRRSQSNSSNYLSITAARWISRSFLPNYWGKSIWTYNCVLPMLKDLDIDLSDYSIYVLKDIENHIKERPSGSASYDNVPNATAQLLEVLASCFVTLEIPNQEHSTTAPIELVRKCENWIIEHLTQADKLPLRDRLYLLNALSRTRRLFELRPEVQREIWSIAQDAFARYSASVISDTETVELTQWLELLTSLETSSKVSATELDKVSGLIILELQGRQQIEGGWKNVSVSGEVLLALLRFLEVENYARSRLIAKDMLLRGVEYLVRTFDVTAGNWSNDINATAKAARTLTLFEKRWGLPSADFFADVNARSAILTFSQLTRNAQRQDGILLRNLLESEANLRAISHKLSSSQRDAARAVEREKVIRVTAFGLVVVSLISTASLILVVWILAASYRQALDDIIGKWSEYLVGGFVSVLVTLVFMGLYSASKKRLLNHPE
uniref:Uncharacterized protein n=1 Tax=Rhodopseudomonas palustris (strain BisA53) TaxID=316055 RepID=Q07U50_RHOP5